MMKKSMKYFGKHPGYNGLIHVAAGVGFGFLLTYPTAGIHPVRWGLSFLLLAVLGHVWAATH